MPRVSEMIGSKYLKKDDVGAGTLVTITRLDQQNLAMKGEAPEYKWVMHFNELDKPLVMNATNLQLCALALSEEATEDWTGRQVVLYDDPNVSMAGKLVGGIRIRAVKRKPPPQIAHSTTMRPPMGELADLEDDLPF